MQLSPVPLTKNQRYDQLTKKVMQRVLKVDSNCIDVGCHKGEILDLMLKYAPNGHHYGFEPIPVLFDALKRKYANNVTISNIALSNKSGLVSFNYVLSNPAYSGLLRRQYDRPREEDTSITVATEMLDTILPTSFPVALMKIDVEGAEMLVLEGAKEVLKRTRPFVIFEHGLGASDVYGTTPEVVYAFFEKIGFRISLLDQWLDGKTHFNVTGFADQFHGRKNHYFLAYPAADI